MPFDTIVSIVRIEVALGRLGQVLVPLARGIPWRMRAKTYHSPWTRGGRPLGRVRGPRARRWSTVGLGVALATVLVSHCSRAWAVAGREAPQAESALSYAVAHESPSPLECDVPCVVSFDGAIVVYGPRWRRFYTIAHDREPLWTLTSSPSEVATRVNATVRAVLRRHGKRTAVVDCGAAALFPSLIGATSDGIVVAVSAMQRGPASPAPAVLTPAAAESLWRVTHSRLSAGRSEEDGQGERAAPCPIFTQAERARMTEVSFADPHVRVSQSWVTHSVGNEPSKSITARVIVVYSPESSRVYALDRLVEEDSASREKNEERDSAETERAVATTLRALGVRQVKIDALSACTFPDVISNRLAPAR